MLNRIFRQGKELCWATYNNIFNDDIAVYSAAIAFYTIFSAAPLLILITSILNIFLSHEQSTAQFMNFFTQVVGADMAQSLMQTAKMAGHESSGIIASIFATVVSLYGATTVVTQLKSALNSIWKIKPPQVNSILLYLLNRVVGVIIILALSLLFLASLVLEGGITFFAGLIHAYVPGVKIPFLGILTSLVSVFMTVLLFAVIYKILPDVQARWRDIFVGACATTFFFLIGKYLVGFYLSSTSIQQSYKTAGSFIVFLIWTYYNSQILLVGAEFTQSYAHLFGEDFKSTEGFHILPWR